MAVENASVETAYATERSSGPLVTSANIVNQDHTLSDALVPAAKTQALTKADLEHTAKEARANAELTKRTGVSVSGSTIAKGK